MTTSPGRDANPNMQRFAAWGCHADCGGNGEAGAHGAFGIGLAGFRPAEIDQHPVTDVTRNEAVKLADGGGDARLVGADDLPQIFGIEPRGEGGGADRSQNITLSGRRSAVVSVGRGKLDDD